MSGSDINTVVPVCVIGSEAVGGTYLSRLAWSDGTPPMGQAHHRPWRTAGAVMQIPVVDIDGDGDLHMPVAGKSGLFLFENLTGLH